MTTLKLTSNEVHAIALNLLNFCGGSLPTKKDLKRFWKNSPLSEQQKNLVEQTSEQLFTNP